MEKNKTEEIEIYKKKYIELFGSENLPEVGKSQYRELPYTKNIAPFVYVDLATHFNFKIKSFPYLFINIGNYLSSLKISNNI